MSWANDFVSALKNHNESSLLQIGVMTGTNTVKVGNLELLPEDLYIPDRLLQQVCTRVSETAPSDGGPCTDKSQYSQPLQTGDKVLVCQLSDDQFVVLERVVSGK